MSTELSLGEMGGRPWPSLTHHQFRDGLDTSVQTINIIEQAEDISDYLLGDKNHLTVIYFFTLCYCIENYLIKYRQYLLLIEHRTKEVYKTSK